MAAYESKGQKELIARVMREAKRGKLRSSSGDPVRNPKQAIAIALHEAGASRDETPARNRRNLRRPKAKGA